MTTSEVQPSTVPSAAVLALLATSVGDPEGTRTITSIVVLLVVLGIALVMLAWWLFRLTRPDKELLAPLEVMGERRWRRADPVWQRRRLDEVRPADAQPLQPSAAPPQFDEAFFEYRPAAAGFEDLHDAAHADGDHPPRDREPANPEAPAEPVPAAVANAVVAPAGDDSVEAEPAAEPAPPALPIKPISPTPIGIERPDLPERDIDPEVMAAAIAELDAELRLGRDGRSETPD